MRIGNIRLKNYIGIYNGLRKYEIYIDFSTCKYNMILINGENGSGKSTLIGALSPFPEDNSFFIANKQAEKELTIIDNNKTYKILFIHSVNSKGERDTTKGYITKYIDDKEIKLNPNGNITSYKEILYSEFNLDPNFIALSKLGVEDRGLVDKKPAERKKFVNNIIESLNVYNNIHRTLSKRSSIFKSMMNNLISKIDYIGDDKKIKLSLQSIDNRINNLLLRKDNLLENMASYKTIISITDPDGSIQELYDNIYKELKQIEIEKQNNDNKINMIFSKLNLENITKDNIYEIYKNNKDILDKLSIEVLVEESKIQNQLVERESDFKSLEIKTQKLNSLNSEMKYEDLKLALKDCNSKIKSYENIFKNVNISNPENISKDEYLTVLDILNTIKESISVFKSQSDYSVVVKALQCIRNNSLLDYTNIVDKINELEQSIITNRDKLYYYKGLFDKMNALDLRPSKCKIDNCPFILTALECSKMNPEKEIETLEELIELDLETLEELKKIKDENIDINMNIGYIKNIIRNVDNYYRILEKFPIKDILLNKEELLNRIEYNNDFKELEVLSNYTDLANIFEEYKYEKERKNKLKSSLSLFESKNSIINDIVEDIDNLNKKLNNVTEDINNKSNLLRSNKLEISRINDYLLDLDSLISIYEDASRIDKKSNELKSEFIGIKTNMIKINEAISNINIYKGEIDSIVNELNPLTNDRDTLKHSISLLKGYEYELEEFKAKYNKIETIKEYSSPNTGIQLLFIEMYMNKILSLSNELLSYLFDGEFELQPFIINEREFRIPCQGEGILNDDISSMSTSQRCLISMILSFSMLYQASTKYNILMLDEIDGGLSESNRIQFLNVLEKQINILNIEQTFLVSHNSELDYNNVDLILLKNSNIQYLDKNLSIIYKS